MKDLVQVIIKDIYGTQMKSPSTIFISRYITVKEVKRIIKDTYRQYWYYKLLLLNNGRIMLDNQFIERYGISDGSVIIVAGK